MQISRNRLLCSIAFYAAMFVCLIQNTRVTRVIVHHHLNTNVFLTKKSVQRNLGKFDEKLFQTKLLSRLSHKICRLFSSPVLLRKFTKNGCKGDWRGGRLREEVPTHLLFGRQFVAGHLSVSSVLSLNVIVPRSLAH